MIVFSAMPWCSVEELIKAEDTHTSIRQSVAFDIPSIDLALSLVLILFLVDPTPFPSFVPIHCLFCHGTALLHISFPTCLKTLHPILFLLSFRPDSHCSLPFRCDRLLSVPHFRFHFVESPFVSSRFFPLRLRIANTESSMAMLHHCRSSQYQRHSSRGVQRDKDCRRYRGELVSRRW